MKNALVKRILLILAALIVIAAASGCRVSVSWLAGEHKALTQGNRYLTESEVRVIALEYKARFERYYKDLLSETFWSREVREGVTCEDFIKDRYILEEARALLYLNARAEEEGLTLTDARKEAIHELSTAFYSELSEDERAYLDSGASTVEKVLLFYETAAEEIEKLAEGKHLEVSDEESRVIDVSVLHVKDEETAALLRERVIKGENFATVARANTLDAKIQYSVSREDLLPEIADALFSLKESEISEVMPIAGEYYVFRVDSAYNVLLSSAGKRNLLAARRYENWEPLYREYLQDHPEKLNMSFWNALKLDLSGDFTDHRLFERLSGTSL